MKICFKCNQEKPFTEFYKHPKMADGYLGKCKQCTKMDVKCREEKLKKDNFEDWHSKEKLRGREKYHRLYGKSFFPVTDDYHIIPMSPTEYRDRQTLNKKKYLQKYPEKKKAKILSQRIIKELKSNHLHHWSYNIEHAKDVIELNTQHHAKAHRFLIYDQERFMYRRIDTMELLDTREKHEAYIFDCIANKPD